MNSSPRNQYRRFNESHHRALVFHLGIDAGFFAEFTYMIHAMLYCAEKGYRFELYSKDANFSSGKGWTEFFEPFCPEVDDAFHHRYNVHDIPGWREMLRRMLKEHRPMLLWWKAKTVAKARLYDLMAYRRYGRRTLSTHDINVPVSEHYDIPGLGIKGNYLEAFAYMTRVVWHFNPHVRSAGAHLLEGLELPPHYAGTQIRGGDKVTEVALRPVSLTISALRKATSLSDVLVLSDDYSLLEQLRHEAPDLTFHSLCLSTENGYVNKAFTHSNPSQKHARMLRFLAQIDALMHAELFVGSITNGPSLFLLKIMGDRGCILDCATADFLHVCHLPIALRGRAAEKFMQGRKD